MLAKRIIPCLDVNRGRVVKGTNFVNLRDAGDPVEVASRYKDEGPTSSSSWTSRPATREREIIWDVVRRTAEVCLHALDGRRRYPDARGYPGAAERGSRQGFDQLGRRSGTPSSSGRPRDGLAANASW